jgi:DNA modification methylase
MGSGSTGVAARKLHRRFIGIDNEEKYLKIAKDRIEEIPVDIFSIIG